MRQILIVHEEDKDKVIESWTKRLPSIKACSNPQEEIFTKWMVTRKDFLEISANKTKDSWTTLGASLEGIGKEQQEEDGSDTEVTPTLNSKLHEVADSLPYLDCMVYLFVFLGSNDLLSSESFIPFAGAVKRLTEWHNARTTIIKIDSELSPHGQKLIEFTKCQCQRLTDEPQIEWPPWNGKLRVMDQLKSEGHMFPHFSLQCNNWESLLKQKTIDKVPVKQSKRRRGPVKDPSATSGQGIAVCGRQIEVVQEVDLRSFPVFMLSPWTLELQSSHHESEAFKSYIQDMKLKGLLVRLRLYYNLKQMPTCGDTNSFSTSAWKDYITGSPPKICEPSDEQITPCMQFMHLLILPNVLLRTSSSNSPLVVKVLLNPTEISPVVFSRLDQRSGFGRNDNNDKSIDNNDKSIDNNDKSIDNSDKSIDSNDNVNEIDASIMSLPLIKADQYCRVLRLYQEHQTQAINDWLDGRVHIGKEEFLQMMTLFEKYAIDSLIEGCGDLSALIKNNGSQARETTPRLRSTPECLKPLSACPERLALQVLNDQIQKSSGGKATTSSTSATPLSARKKREMSGIKDFHVEEVLKMFHLDGNSKQVTRTPIKLKGKSICRVPSQPDLSSKWPDNQFLKYHDIFYYNSEEDLEFENKYVHVRDKGCFVDSRSSFVTPKKKPPTRHLTKMSPVRSSPRAKGTNPLLSRSHSQSLSSLSPMKKFKMAGDLFKQPSSSRIIRKSPRKRPASSLTPNSDPPPFKSARTHQIGSLGSLSDLATPVRRSPRKQLSFGQRSSSFNNPVVKRLSLTSAPENEVRRSPRKTSTSSSSSPFGSANTMPRPRSFDLSSSQSSLDLDSSVRDPSRGDSSQESKKPPMKRSDRHKMRLQSIIATVLKEKGVKKEDVIYSSCYRNLFNVSLVLLKTLPNSVNLTEEMKSVVFTQVQQIINLEKRRSGIAL